MLQTNGTMSLYANCTHEMKLKIKFKAYIVVGDGLEKQTKVESCEEQNGIGSVSERGKKSNHASHVCKRCHHQTFISDDLQLWIAI